MSFGKNCNNKLLNWYLQNIITIDLERSSDMFKEDCTKLCIDSIRIFFESECAIRNKHTISILDLSHMCKQLYTEKKIDVINFHFILF